MNTYLEPVDHFAARMMAEAPPDTLAQCIDFCVAFNMVGSHMLREIGGPKAAALCLRQLADLFEKMN